MWRGKVSNKKTLKGNLGEISVSQLCPSTCRFFYFKISWQLFFYRHCHWRWRQVMPCQPSLGLRKEIRSGWELYRICSEQGVLMDGDICSLQLQPAFLFLTSAGNKYPFSTMASFASCPVAGSTSNVKVGASGSFKHPVPALELLQSLEHCL